MDIDVGGAAALLAGGRGGGGADEQQSGGGGGQQEQQSGGGDQGGGEQSGGELPDWARGVSADGDAENPSNRDWIKSKGFKDLDGMVKSLRDTEKALRDGGRIKLPGEGATAEDLAAFNKAIGVPDDAKGYEVKMPETTGGLELNGDLIGKLADIAHQAGTPKGAFEALANAYVQHQVDEHMADVQKQDQLTQAKLAAWGADKDAKLADCQAAMRGLGLDRAKIAQLQAAWGSDAALDFLAKIGGGMAEDTLITDGTGRFGISAAEAQNEINQMKADPAMANKIMVRGSAEQQRWNRLNDVVEAANKKSA